MVLRSWAGLLDSIRTGKPAAELAGFDSGFELIADKPRLVRMFNEAMAAFTRTVIPAVLGAYDFSGIGRLIDLGGGHGQLFCAILQAYPDMRGAVFDLPRCAEGAKRQLAEAGVGERGEFIAGSFFESVPDGADALLLKSIIHDWDEERSLKILGNCRGALAEGARLLLIERLMPELPKVDPKHRDAVLSDLNMLRGTGGRE
jgi:O-methyltransferase domain